MQAVNQAFSRISGYSEAEVLGQNPRLLQSFKQQEQSNPRPKHRLRLHHHRPQPRPCPPRYHRQHQPHSRCNQSGEDALAALARWSLHSF
ncbi:MAG: PAS domain S-box protein [Chloroflexia bacterium]|nr:PAS domain S-box protein [Chloroflexia bacterium]